MYLYLPVGTAAEFPKFFTGHPNASFFPLIIIWEKTSYYRFFFFSFFRGREEGEGELGVLLNGLIWRGMEGRGREGAHIHYFVMVDFRTLLSFKVDRN